jgi:hypothetical protein
MAPELARPKIIRVENIKALGKDAQMLGWAEV